MMRRFLIVCFFLLVFSRAALGQDAEPPAADASAEAAVADVAHDVESEAVDADEPMVTGEDGERTMSGMSVLGNEEAPKSLVIIPWKSSEIGSDLGLSDTLDDRARPVDKEVFLRELRFYEIRADETGDATP